MKRLISLALALVLICSLFAGCFDSARPTEKTDPSQSEPEQSKPDLTEPATTEVPLPSLAWTTAFRMKDLREEGEVAADQIAFFQVDGTGAKTVVNIPKTEVYENQPERLPRTHFFEQYMTPELIEELLPALDYAIAHGFSRMCIPTTRLSYGAIESAGKYLVQTYRINENKIGSLGVKDVELPDGQTLTFLLITIGGMENRGLTEQYLDGIDTARAIVDEMPQDLDEKGKMLYLYR